MNVIKYLSLHETRRIVDVTHTYTRTRRPGASAGACGYVRHCHSYGQAGNILPPTVCIVELLIISNYSSLLTVYNVLYNLT